jgi:HK97 family phage major capsid protein/HK97 family phage prohead protease
MQPLRRRFIATTETSTDELLAASLSSEEPYDRGGYIEILDHTPQSIDMSRAAQGLPLLMNHDLNQVAGRVEQLDIQSRRLRGMLRLFDTQAGREARAMVENGHREVSISYRVLDSVEQRDETGRIVVRVTRWQLLEASIVGVPADPSVGIGRSFQPLSRKSHIMNTQAASVPSDPSAALPGDTLSRAQRRAQGRAAAAVATELADERQRAADISNIVSRHAGALRSGESAERFIADGWTVADVQELVLERMSTRPTDTRGDFGRGSFRPAASWGSSDGPTVEHRQYAQLVDQFSLGRAIQSQIDPVSYLRSAALESEVSQELRRSMPMPTSGMLVPLQVLFREDLERAAHKRALSSGVAGLGGATVMSVVDPTLFTDALRARMIVGSLGARMLMGLSSNTLIPRKTATTTAAWLAEAGASSATDPTFDQVQLTPKRIGSFVEFSKQLAAQSSLEIETMIREDLSTTALVELDRAALVGTGTGNQPRGITNTSGIGAVIGGANGAAINYTHILELERQVAQPNGMVNLQACGYAINPATRSWLKRQLKVPGVSGPTIMGDEPLRDAGLSSLNGYAAGISTLLPNNGNKGTSTGVCSTLIFGDFSQLMVGTFGGAAEILLDEISLAPSGQNRLILNMFADVAVRYPASFAVMNDGLTA